MKNRFFEIVVNNINNFLLFNWIVLFWLNEIKVIFVKLIILLS